jgi:prepilin-type N-terminal cleavage/methylation domain-containing protein
MAKKIIKHGFIPLEKSINCNSRPSGNVKSLSLQPVRKRGSLTGFTMIELMVTVLIASVVMLGIGGVIADAHKGFRQMYDRIHGDIVTDAYAARLKFDKMCRKARAGTAALNEDATAVLVLYYSAPNDTNDPYLPPDRYAIFYQSGTNLMLDTGTTATWTPDTTEIVAGNVTELQFSVPVDVKSVQMVMTLDEDQNPDDDSGYSITITCGSIMHN